MNERIKKIIESVLNERISEFKLASGGCINDSRIIRTETGKEYFIKISNQNNSDIFIKEANGLKEIKSTDEIRTPEVIFCSEEILILEAIAASSRKKNFSEDFGRRFAKMHKHYSETFGFYEDNYIGSTPQINLPDEEESTDWTKFYFNKRLLFQFRLAEQNGYVDTCLRKLFGKVENKIQSILKCNNIKPSLLHGDLWGGNYIVDENGFACLIDPAVYYGHREADLAMTRLFGGFDANFYSAYNEEFPLEPGYEYRENIYKLYHVLNHLNLFGTGYLNQVKYLLNYYV